MKPAPTNRNVPQWMWDSAMADHAAYLIAYNRLRKVGLTDQQADAYFDLHGRLSEAIDKVDPSSNEDFAVDDLGQTFRQLAALSDSLERLWLAQGKAS